jgi:hypothetical protein
VKDDNLRRELLDDLWLMRKGSAAFDLAKLSTAYALVDQVGRGSPDQAYAALLAQRDAFAADPESDVIAYFETSGLGGVGKSLELRLLDYAQRHHVNERTARRHSDSGAERLSNILRGGYLYERPWGMLTIIQRGQYIHSKITIELPEYSMWRRPYVEINEKHVEDLDFELRNSTASHAMMVRGSERLPLTAMGKNAEGYLFTLRATWMMPVWPTWTVTSRLEDPRLYAFMSVSRGGDAEANVDWVGDTGHFSDLDGDTLAEERR